jgi:lipoprotein LprG
MAGMPRVRPLLAFLVVVPFVLAGATGCTNKSTPGGAPTGNLPAGDMLVKDSAAAMRDVQTAKFLITADATVAGLSLKRAEGTLTKEGSAQGTAQITEAGMDVELTFVVVGDKIYVKGPTGGYQTLPLALAASVYDPSAILDPNRGIAKVLSTATDAKTEAQESVDGKPAWRVAIKVNGDDLATVIPGMTGTVAAKVWLSTADKRLLKATFTMPASGGAKGGNVTVTFTDYDAPATITAPSGS